MLNSLKTTFGFIGHAIKARSPIVLFDDKLGDFFSYLGLYQGLGPSGQPNDCQLVAISESGYIRVLNLAPNSKLENAGIDEARSVLEKVRLVGLDL